MLGDIRAFSNLLLPFLDGGNLNVSSIDMEAEDEAVIEAEPDRPKRKLIATLQVIIGVTDLAFSNLQCVLGPHCCWALKQLVRPWSQAGMCVHI